VITNCILGLAFVWCLGAGLFEHLLHKDTPHDPWLLRVVFSLLWPVLLWFVITDRTPDQRR